MARPPFGFEPVEHTADAAIRGWGRDLPELFSAMARGLFDVIAEGASVRATQRRRVTLGAETLDDLLHDWLEVLNTLHQVHRELYRDFVVDVEGMGFAGGGGSAVSGHRLEATAIGEAIDPARHELRMEVKAVTWHGLSVRRTREGYEAYVLLDI